MPIASTLKSLGARLTMEEVDVRAMLERDHDQFKELLQAMVDGKQGRSRLGSFQALKTNLSAHARAEEKIVYDALIQVRAKQETHVLAEEGYVEHALTDELIARLGRLDVDTDTWLAHAKVLRELLQHHIQEEQNQTFAELGDYFDRDTLADMGRRFQQLKAKVLRDGPGKQRTAASRIATAQRGKKAAKRVASPVGNRKSAKRAAAGRRVASRVPARTKTGARRA